MRFSAAGAEFANLNLGVYVDLLRLGRDYGLKEVLSQLMGALATSLGSDAAGVRSAVMAFESSHRSFEEFCTSLLCALNSVGPYTRVVFFLDEAKKLDVPEVGRGFKDNLFALMYGGPGELDGRVCFVLAGAQDLYAFAEDSTSPIASRAAVHYVNNLEPPAVTELLIRTCGASEHAPKVFDALGGHAGLTALAAIILSKSSAGSAEELALVLSALADSSRELFRIWHQRLSVEARAVHDYIVDVQRVDREGVLRVLKGRAMDVFAADRAMAELSFTGIAKREHEELECCVRPYWDYVAEHHVESAASEDELETWSLIKTTELELRSVIRNKYSVKWPADHGVSTIRSILGPKSVARIEESKRKREKRYRASDKDVELDDLDFSYIGDLASLVAQNSAWMLFKVAFKDKLEFDHLIQAIAPVRNEEAHFRSVPRRELDRCRIACEDLLERLAEIT
jgi:hypothetical protein